MTYVEISLSEFLDFLEDNSLVHKAVMPSDDTKEYVFDIVATKNTVLRVFSSVDVRSKISREYGADAIRLVLINAKFDVPIFKGKKTLRMENWRNHLIEKINHILDNPKFFDRMCPACNNPLVIRIGRSGEFWGCSKYPGCRYTDTYVEPARKQSERVHQEWIFELKLSNMKRPLRCPACGRKGHIQSTNKEWCVRCGICGTRGRIINDL